MSISIEWVLWERESKFLVDLVDKALLKLHAYPNLGELYFNILTTQYIYKVKYTDAELIETLSIERTQYYKRKKEAVNLFGVIAMLSSLLSS